MSDWRQRNKITHAGGDDKPDKEREPVKPFEHYCPCGAWGSFGFGVNVREGKEGVWRCFEHKDWWR